MKYFAKIGLNNKVTAILNVDDSVLKDAGGNEHESLGVAFLEELTGWAIWKETWKDGSQRKHFAGIGFTFDEGRDAFIRPQPHPSWTLNESTCDWDPPESKPAGTPLEGYVWTWDEAQQKWINNEQ